MKSKRLTNDMKRMIVNDLREDLKEGAGINELEQAQYAVGIAIKDDILGKHKEVIESLPSLFTSTVDDFFVECEAEGDNRNTFLKVFLGDYYPAWPDRYHQSVKIYPKNSKLIAAYREATDKLHQANERINEAYLEAKHLLSGVSTTKKLLEIWPEAEKYLDKEDVVTNLPMVQADTLRCKIDRALGADKDCGGKAA